MRLPLAALFVSLFGIGVVHAAEAVTYAGAIGSLPIILELTSPGADGLRAGRYAYLAKGGDIPLHGMKVTGRSALRLSEEKPCTEKLCKTAHGDVIDVAPMAAEWNLIAEGAGARLSGTWRDEESGKTLPVNLVRKGKRTISDTEPNLLDALDPSYAQTGTDQPTVLSEDSLPYDFLKMDRPLKQGVPTDLGGKSYRMDEDRRTGLSYPVVLSIGKVDPAPLNRYLAQQRLQFALPAFSCMARAYLGFGWSGQDAEGTSGYDGGGSVTVEHLTSRLMGIAEGGSYWCGGAHPSNFGEHRLADARTGKALVPETMLRGWAATNANGTVVDPSTVADPSLLSFGPNEDLIQFVIENRDQSDDETEKDCNYNDLIRSNLAVYFTQEELIFTLQGLPHVIFACTDDLLKVPLKDSRPLLTDAGAGYFEVLDR
ncbi:hypothetical protein J2X76_002708 [Neorhizobium sp. 2083]|uniref:hypothetical protein n=1 Tax=Neorhizobium sp. 2083 TaxID=2817762 RepID=UPI00285A791B|nr:hypothetical protein [Neorhizobium sp. 2083]MDR6817532.1 hypothetical protein [Neorhizobium sp. 2083]